VSAYGFECWLVQRFNATYRQSKDYLAMTASLFQWKSTLHLAHGLLHVQITSPADGRRARHAFIALCAELTARELRWPNTDVRLHFGPAQRPGTFSRSPESSDSNAFVRLVT